MKFKIDDLDREAVALALPALGALISEPLYVLADTAVVGRIGTPELGGLGLATQVIGTVISVSIFLAYGTTSAVSRLMGAKREREAAQWAVQSMWVAITFGLISAIICFAAAPWLMETMRATPQVAKFVVQYLRVAVWGFPAMLVMLAGVGYLRGNRDTVRPLIVAVATAISNLLIEVFLVFGLGYGVGASALSTVIVQYAGAATYLYWINTHVSAQNVAWKPVLALLSKLGRDGLDLLIRTSALRATALVGAAVAAGMGPVLIAGHEVALQVFALVALALDAMAIAAQAMIGERVGAKATKDVFAVTKRLTSWCVGLSLLLSGLIFIGRTSIGRIFTKDPDLLLVLPDIWILVCVLIPVASLAFTFDGVLIGAGDMRFLAISMAISAGVYFAVLQIGQNLDTGIQGVWMASIAMMTSRVVLLGLRLKSRKWLPKAEL